MKSKLFQSDEYLAVAKRTQDFLNAQNDFLSANTIKSTRAVGDALLEFYPKEIGKIQDRIGYFEKVKERWKQKPE